MLDLGWTELLLIGIVALIVVGPKDLPGMFRTLGRFTGKMKNMAREFQRAMNDAADEAGMNDVAKDLKSATSAKSMGLDKLNSAADRFEKWEPGKSKKDAAKDAAKDKAGEAAEAAGEPGKPKAEAEKGPETQKLSEERAEQARKIRESAAKKAEERRAAAAAADAAETAPEPEPGPEPEEAPGDAPGRSAAAKTKTPAADAPAPPAAGSKSE
ncbi:Sec-independent protein translocase protein TatB [Psychromarinibacter sp. C21-152]|uniref:Sec-independent protein translocase protein TatB n=1 Tax=Psychromarinibacter sediminicola TaxID=3033385 RepID=A0AAE3NLL8_9RHOB|nr:Sec-independent protein translocase protein TatB [Psychromarinibacter sediminicola]MDF0600093.1 Sec-independent protein translocase protein TatB [Psychromarinibacter sediminicola]